MDAEDPAIRGPAPNLAPIHNNLHFIYCVSGLIDDTTDQLAL